MQLARLLFLLGSQSLGAPEVVVEDRPQPLSFRVEVADTPSKQERGLMFVNHLPKERGMLFVFPHAARRYFWMVNTFIPLDMVFIDTEHRVTDVVHSAEPLSRSPRGSPEPSQYVLELAGGVASAQAIVPGTRVRFVDLP
jgi:uncharacterized membrane protein (UPF0127 family)